MQRLNPYTIRLFAVLVLANTAALGACGDSGSGLDNDAGTNTSDASNIPGDNDNDGYPAAEDCDDSDPNIYPGVTRDCQSDCDVGVEICLATGDWNDCTARTDCDCDNPGETRLVDCGMCGEASQECGLDLLWGVPGTCTGEGECHAGQSDEEPCEFCGTRSRVCGTECTWQPWDSGGCFGSCVAGTEDATTTCANAWERQPTVCNTSCEWENSGNCASDCMGTPRTGTTDFKDEVCIPGGLSFMGADPGEGSSA